MASTRYELRFYRDGREVREQPPTHEVLDLRANLLELFALLDRHLYAAAERCGLRRNEAHRLLVEVRPVDDQGRGYGEPVLRRALPVDDEGYRR